MAVIEAAEFAGTKTWAEGSAWVGGSAPTENDDAVFGEKSGTVEVAAEAKARSIKSTATYKGTLKVAAATTLKVGAATVNATNVIWEWLGGTFSAATTTAQVTFGSSSATQVKVFANLSTFGALKFTGKGSYLLEQKLATAAAATTTIEECTWNTNSQECSLGFFNSSNALTRTVNIENSIVKVAATGTVWTMSTKTGLTFKAAGSTIEMTDTSVTLKTLVPGTEQKFNKLKFSGGAANPKFKIGTTTTINILEFTEGQKATLEVTSGVKITVEKIIGHGASGKLITIEAGTPAASFEFTATALSVFAGMDWISFKDCHASATSTWYAGANSTNVSGNENLKFESFKHPHTFEVTQASTAVKTRLLERQMTLTQAQSAVATKQAATSRTLSLTQGQSAIKAAALARSLSITQAQSPTMVRSPSRSLSSTQGSTPSRTETVGRTLTVAQGQSATRVESMTRALSVTQGQAAVKVAALARTLSATQAQTAARSTNVGRILSSPQASSTTCVTVVSRTLSASQGQVATQTRSAATVRTLTAEQAQAASFSHSLARTLTTTQGQSVARATAVSRTLTCADGQAVTLTEEVIKAAVHEHTLAATQGESVTFNRGLARGLNSAQGQALSLAANPARFLSATQGQAMSLARSPTRQFVLTQPIQVRLSRTLARTLAASTATSALVIRGIDKPTPTTVGSVVSLSKCVERTLALSQNQTAAVVAALPFRPGKLASTITPGGVLTSDATTGVMTSSAVEGILTSTTDSDAMASTAKPKLRIESSVD